jgi:hypothetical protein
MEREATQLLRVAEDHDRAGRETEAVLSYERAIDLGLPISELAGALHGLGSTYRALGRYDDASRICTMPCTGFRAMRVLARFSR